MRKVLVRFGLLVGVVVVAGLAFVGWQVVQSARPVALPRPRGAHPVGRATFEWADPARPDPLAPGTGPRELPVWVWYPAAAGSGSAGTSAPYAPGRWSALHFPAPVGLGESRFSAVRTHSSVNAAPAPGRFPVVVLEPGLGFSAPQYQALAESLAAQGYYVAGVTPTDSANVAVLRGRVVGASAAGDPKAFDGNDLHTPEVTRVADALTAVWAADARFAAGRLAAEAGLGEHVDRARTAYAGHSFGGSAALEACRLDAHCVAAADLDGTQYGDVTRLGLTKPFIVVQSGGSCVTGTCTSSATDSGDVAVAHRLLTASPASRRCYAVDRTEHFGFTDYGVYHLARPLRRLLPLGSAPGRAVLTQTAATLGAFLRGDPPGPQPLLRPLAC